MPKFFVEPKQIDNDHIVITGENAHHISRSLRMMVGESITVSDMNNIEYKCTLEKFTDNSVIARIEEKYTPDVESCVRIHLFQALPKGEKLDFIIQKSVECGAYEIIPFESDRCVAKVKQEVEGRKSERRNKIALEAAKQCGRAIVPVVHPTVSFSQMISMASSADLALFCYEGDGTISIGNAIKEAKIDRELKDIAIIIGSEGGFSPLEADIARKNGHKMIGLGKRILRAETAAIFALSCLVYEFELS